MTEKEMWFYLRDKGLSLCATAGIMGNFQAESGLQSNNVENRCPMSDEAYTEAVDNGTIDFIYDAYGYGLPQYTYWSLKRGLLNFCSNRGVSISNAQAQIDYLCELLLSDYAGTLKKLQESTTPEDASTIFLLEFERPADMGTATRNYRGGLARQFYEKYKNITSNVTAPTPTPTPASPQIDILKTQLTNETVGHLQTILRTYGYDLVPDGLIGKKTITALEDFTQRIKNTF